jgi:filamentous hemagglutinin family protein
MILVCSKMKHIVVTLLGLGLAALHANAQASANGVPSVQVSPDETLRAQPSVVDQGTNGNITIRGGAQQGGNLFHSFLEFSISAGQRVCFENPSGVTNILSRVTGDRPSNIDGTLGVNGNANLFFINPNGLLFGPNSRLDMAGVFVGSTASSIQLADRTTYSAVAPAAPLLTMAVPTGLQFGATAESIRLNNANSLLPKNIVEQDISKQGSGFILVGGDISLENSKLSIPGGKFEFAAVGPNTSVDINFAELSNPHGLSIAVPTAQNRMDVLLLNGSRLRTTGKTSGDVSLIANNIEISGTLDSSNEPGRSVINVRPLGVANKPSEKQGGNVTLDATNNILMNGYFTGISTSPQETSDIDGGDVRITAKSMQILNGAYLQTSTGSTSTGKGGSISLDIKKSLEPGIKRWLRPV